MKWQEGTLILQRGATTPENGIYSIQDAWPVKGTEGWLIGILKLKAAVHTYGLSMEQIIGNSRIEIEVMTGHKVRWRFVKD